MALLANVTLTDTFDLWRTRTNQIIVGLDATDQVANAAFSKANTAANTTTYSSNVVISVLDNSNAALRVTQTGNGLSILVEDNVNPDSTPFVVDANGNVGIGTITPNSALQIYNATNANTLLEGDAAVTTTASRNSTDASGPSHFLRKARGTTVAKANVASGDNIGAVSYQAYGGTTYRTLSRILAYVDTFTSDSDISSYVTITTSPAGSAAGVERVRVTSTGNVGIGTTTVNYKLDVAGSVNASTYLINGIPLSLYDPNANAAFDKANSANLLALAGNVTANAAFDGANTAFSAANSANIVAVSAFAKANAALPNTSGASFVGNLNFPTGNVAFGATSTSGLGRVFISGNYTVGDYAFVNRHASSSANTTRGFRQVIDGAEYLAIYHTNTGAAIEVNTSERIRIDGTSGNVGIGTTTPGYRLDVAGAVNASAILVNGTTLASGVANVQTFNASGTWTKPSGFSATSRVLLQAWGGGGSGRKDSSGSTAARGGGGGGYIERWMTLSDLSATETVTVGAGGTAITATNTNGNNGGNSSVGSKLLVYGGGGGSAGGNYGGGYLGLASPYLVTGVSASMTGCYVSGVNYNTQGINDHSIHYGGAGADGSVTVNGYRSIFGGGGGGIGASASPGAGGISSHAGSGGGGGAGATAGTAGTAPAGGGGGSYSGTSGAGAAGRIIISIFPA